MKKRLVLQLALLAVLIPVCCIAAFYVHENWTGYREWREVASRLAARGEPLSVAEIRPQPVPDEQNLAAAPIFQELFSVADPLQSSIGSVRLPPAPADATGSAGELISLARRFRADFDGEPTEAAGIIHAGLAPLESILLQIAEATARPDTVWPVKMDQGYDFSMPFLDPLIKVSEVLAARSAASLATSNTALARQDLELILDLARRVNQSSLLITALAEQAILQRAVDIVASGLLTDAWSDRDLEELQTLLASFRPLESLARSLRNERAFFLEHADKLSGEAAPYFRIVDLSSRLNELATRSLSAAVWHLRPSGWNALDRARYSEMVQLFIDGAIPRGKLLPDFVQAWQREMASLRRNQLEFFKTPLTVLALPALNNVARSGAYTQAQLDMAVTACAIERYRRTFNKFPDSLDDLAGRFQSAPPLDVIRGGPLAYKPSGDTYLLYSIGWNGQDDGGRALAIGRVNAADWIWE